MTRASQRLASAASSVLERRLSRRGLFARAAVVGSAVTTSGLDYILRPGTAYASVCGSGNTCSSGWTAMCCTVNHGVNQCPPGSFAGGWWKAEGASLCGGQARYYIDCQAECTHCHCHGSHFCSERCWDCKPHCAHGGCDQRRVCHNVFRYGQCDRNRHCSGPVLCRAISCTPPWQWANCSSAAATDNFTVSHSAACLPKWTPIQQRYTALGSQGSVLGASVDGEHTGAHGHVQRYRHGRMYWSKGTGARYLTGHALTRYVQLGEMSSPLGLPVTDIDKTRDGKGTHARFQHGGIYDGPGHGAHALWGPVWHKWLATDGTLGVLGYPTTDLRRTANHSGHYAIFTGGSIYQRHGHRAHELLSDFADKYHQLGAAGGPLGYPTADQAPATDGRGVTGVEVVCETGAIGQATGHKPHGVWGPIYDTWNGQGRAAGELGFPITDVFDVHLIDGPGQRCRFEYGYATYDETTRQVTVTMTS
ncbi:MAG: hypothetical protein QOI25_1493 [Mycobacterium sp.]|nr:hypothetical protein [Mycobacterium sp.]